MRYSSAVIEEFDHVLITSNSLVERTISGNINKLCRTRWFLLSTEYDGIRHMAEKKIGFLTFFEYFLATRIMQNKQDYHCWGALLFGIAVHVFIIAKYDLEKPTKTLQCSQKCKKLTQ